MQHKHVLDPQIDLQLNEKRIESIRACRFADIQGLCSYLFKKPFDEIENFQLPTDLKELSDKVHIPEEILVEVMAKTAYFQNQLSFLDSEKGIQQVAAIELSNSLDLPVPGMDTDVNLIPPQKVDEMSEGLKIEVEPMQSSDNNDNFLEWWHGVPEDLTTKACQGNPEINPLLNQVNYVLVCLHKAGKHDDKPSLQQFVNWIKSGQITLKRK